MLNLAERLTTEQDGIFAILAEAEAMLTDQTTRDIPGLARARWALMRALTGYDLLKNSKLLDRIIAQGRTADARRAERLKQQGGEAVAAFRGNVTKWSATDVAAVWPDYQPSALAMIARLREQVTRERTELMRMLDQA